MAGSCVTGLAATITYNIYIQGEKTILAASDVERFYSGHRRRLLSTRNSVSRNANADVVDCCRGELYLSL